MIPSLDILEKATKVKIEKAHQPDAFSVVKALLNAEKKARKEKVIYAFDQLMGIWNLSFITGTQKARKKAGIILGSGRYIPKLVKISILYSQDQEQCLNMGKVKNSVELGFFNLYFTGPIKFIEPKNILAFDFTQIGITIFGLKVFQGYVRGGKSRENNFYESKLSEQAFFSYFLIDENLIAARGKGGGLALWSRAD